MNSIKCVSSAKWKKKTNNKLLPFVKKIKKKFYELLFFFVSLHIYFN
jgi:hypothetical protein